MPRDILPVTEERVPSVIGMKGDEQLVIGRAAKELGIKGRTNTYHFKTELGKPQDDSQYEIKIGKGGKIRAAKAKPFWVTDPDSQKRHTFTPLEATRNFLRELIPDSDMDPAEFIVGEPALDQSWKENYRRNIRKVFSELGLREPTFFPEPFAVYQYYRHVDKLIPSTGERQNVLVVDFGGGTFDCCVIQTTREGELARGGARALPLGVQSCQVAGEAVDIELLKCVRDFAIKKKVRFKEDPIDRAKDSAQSLWVVENAKIALSNRACSSADLSDASLKKISTSVRLPAGTFHPTENLDATLTGLDLKKAITHLWHIHWGKVLLDCHAEASEKLDGEIEKYDVVLLAGGSAQLPFLRSLVQKTLPIHLDAKSIVAGNYVGAAVASGIAVECREQADKRPDLVNNRLVSCLLNDLYLRVGRRKDEHLAPKIRRSNSVADNKSGMVYRSPGILEEEKIRCTLELQHAPKGALHYWFHDTETAKGDPLNIISMSVRIPGSKAYDKKVTLELGIQADGMVTPKFILSKSGRDQEEVEGQPFNLAGERVEGRVFVGLDFGTCNSYITKFISPIKQVEQAAYPDYGVGRETSARLLRLEDQCNQLKKSGVLNHEAIVAHAKRNRNDFIFHSNKIEGNPLSRGQTEGTLKSTGQSTVSLEQREVLNLAAAYEWMLENCDGSIDQLTGFVRELNRRLLDGIEKNAGAYRTESVSIGGVEYQPPPPGSVDDFMSKLSTEIRDSHGKTSGLELSVRAHTKLVAIHPFVDGNGRSSRLLMAAILMAHELPIVVLNSDDKERYLGALSKSNGGSLDSLLDLFADLMEQSLLDVRELGESLVTRSGMPDSMGDVTTDDASQESTPTTQDSSGNGLERAEASKRPLDMRKSTDLAELLKHKGEERRRQPTPPGRRHTICFETSSNHRRTAWMKQKNSVTPAMSLSSQNTTWSMRSGLKHFGQGRIFHAHGFARWKSAIDWKVPV